MSVYERPLRPDSFLNEPMFVKEDAKGRLYLGDGIFPVLYADYVSVLRRLEETIEGWTEDEWNDMVRRAYESFEKQVRPSIPRPKKQCVGYVYLIKQVGGVHFKIGVSSKPEQRLKHFTVTLPFRIEPVCIIASADMYALEAELHAKFASARVDGEWFALEDADVEYIKGLAS